MFRRLTSPLLMAAALAGLFPRGSAADDTLHRYEARVPPYDPSAGWLGYPCSDPCADSIEDGHFVLRWSREGQPAAYMQFLSLAELPTAFWVEWRFRSNHPIGPFFTSCDGAFFLGFRSIIDGVDMYGDAAVSFEGGDFVVGLDLTEFHTYRFETPDGVHYDIAVDGTRFISSQGSSSGSSGFLSFSGSGGCPSDQFPGMMNEWDYVRYGTISYGEKIVASDPPGGFLDARKHADLDCFAVTFDSPNYVYVNEITVETIGALGATGGLTTSAAYVPPQVVPPQVIATRRGEESETAVVNGIVVNRNAPETVEIVLDRPIPMGATTRFTFNDGVATNVVEYTFAPGDTDGDGDVDLRELAWFQNCIGQSPPAGACLALDLTRDGSVNLPDLPGLLTRLSAP